MRKIVIVNKWLANAKSRDLSAESGSYNAEFSDLVNVEGADDQIGFIGEISRETEKAVCLATEVADVTGDARSWRVWFPKSQIVRVLDMQ